MLLQKLNVTSQCIGFFAEIHHHPTGPCTLQRGTNYLRILRNSTFTVRELRSHNHLAKSASRKVAIGCAARRRTMKSALFFSHRLDLCSPSTNKIAAGDSRARRQSTCADYSRRALYGCNKLIRKKQQLPQRLHRMDYACFLRTG